jgi:hypothetical protein
MFLPMLMPSNFPSMCSSNFVLSSYIVPNMASLLLEGSSYIFKWVLEGPYHDLAG